MNNFPKHKEDARLNAPTRRAAIVFRGKATLLQVARSFRNTLKDEIIRFPRDDKFTDGEIIAESTSRLWMIDDVENHAEQHLLAGKVHNLRLALKQFNGVEVPANQVFSFWAHAGRASRRKGYVRGRELREGCIIPNIGGGLCQLSNALYDAALKAEFEIVERHAHTRIIPDSLAEIGRDATVFWNYVDLRFRAPHVFRIEVLMTGENLIVRFRRESCVQDSISIPARVSEIERPTVNIPQNGSPQSCASCDVHECFRHQATQTVVGKFGRTAFLVDEYWSEYDAYIGAQSKTNDVLCVPLNGKKFGKANYAWNTARFDDVRESRLLTLRRAYQSRRFAAQGASRQRALLHHAERLAASFASQLTYDVTHVVVMQNLLPFLWREGHFGGRTFDVLMTNLPFAVLHETLDAAHRRHPESSTLNDFRASAWLLENENEALRHARRIITPHSYVADLFADKAMLLDWHLSKNKTSIHSQNAHTAKSKIVFPAATVGRKGAYEMREAAKKLNLQIATVGAQLEGADFWRGVSVEHKSGVGDWLADAALVVLPAYVENRPRRLLEAVARGVPVIASTACGLVNVKGVVNIQAGDVRRLFAAIKNED